MKDDINVAPRNNQSKGPASNLEVVSFVVRTVQDKQGPGKRVPLINLLDCSGSLNEHPPSSHLITSDSSQLIYQTAQFCPPHQHP